MSSILYPREVAGYATVDHFHFSFVSHDITGPFSFCYSPAGLISISFYAVGGDSSRSTFAMDRAGTGASPGSSGGEIYREQLLEYLGGERRSFTFPVDMTFLNTHFQRRVLEATAAIPFGRVKTYKEIAISIGRPGACRAVGNALGSNPLPLVFPCHRVIASGNRLGGFMRNVEGGREIKKRLLRLEGLNM